MSLSKRQNEIIDTALRLTAQGGIHALTIKNLSAAIGVTEPALYRHFKNKSEIIKAMIERFDAGVPLKTLDNANGMETVWNFLRGRFSQVLAAPELARVMFSEEMFLDDPEFSKLVFELMHQHKELLAKNLQIAQNHNEIRGDIAPEMLFRILLGSVRLLIKQWGMSRGAFDLRNKSEELLTTLKKLLAPPPQC